MNDRKTDGMRMKKGLFLTLEGLDGCGKSTQLCFLADYLKQKGLDILLTREPGGCGISEQVREILLSPENKGMSAQTETLLYAAARAQHIDEKILPALEQGKIVLCDRYLDSSIAYQGYGRGLGEDRVREANRYAIEHCLPDATFLFLLEVERAGRRIKSGRVNRDRLEQEGSSFFEKVDFGFRKLAQQERRVRVVDAGRSVGEVWEDLKAQVEEVLEHWCGI